MSGLPTSMGVKIKNILKVIYTLLLVELLSCCIATVSDTLEEHFLCRHCGHDVAELHFITNIPSTMANYVRNETFYLDRSPALIHSFTNPLGQDFNVVTTSLANVSVSGEASKEATFFPGFSWQVIQCPQCGLHMGWLFETILTTPSQIRQAFYGLLRDNLLRESDVDNLLVMPRVFGS